MVVIIYKYDGFTFELGVSRCHFTEVRKGRVTVVRGGHVTVVR